jgi:hypothetical protein
VIAEARGRALPLAAALAGEAGRSLSTRNPGWRTAPNPGYELRRRIGYLQSSPLMLLSRCQLRDP